jgi:hypothetical protein
VPPSRFDEIIQQEEPLLVPPDDPRALHVQAVAERLIQTLQDETPVSCAIFPRESVMDRLEEKAKRRTVVPSAQAQAASMPFLPDVRRVVGVPSEHDVEMADRAKVLGAEFEPGEAVGEPGVVDLGG